VKIPLKRYLLPALIFASIFASWQGIGASNVTNEGLSPADCVSNLHANVPVPTSGITETDQNETTAVSYDKPSVPPESSAVADENSPVNRDSGRSWALVKIHASPSTSGSGDSSSVPVAVLDTGIDKSHEELADRVFADINLTDSPTSGDVFGHGTPIAGIIAAGNDGLGVVGLAPESQLINVKVADDSGRCRLSALAEGIVWAVDHGARVINISIELKDSAPELQEAVDYAWDNGVVIVAAAGNDGNSQPVYPAAYENCIAVTGIQEDGTLAPLANYGDWVDVAAPGFDIYSILPGNAYGYKYGTSFAAAYVSGLAALLFPVVTDADGDGWLNDDVRQAIESACDPIDIAGTGHGLIDVAGSLSELP
jgi:subtilisin family serine protease